MRLTKISFNGFKRLRDTACNMDGKLIALLGPNEAGKSSVLQGLQWFSDIDAPLPEECVPRAFTEDIEGPVVTAIFTLDESDHQALDGIETSITPTKFKVVKYASGKRSFETLPKPGRVRAPFEEAASRAVQVRDLVLEFWVDSGDSTTMQDMITELLALTENPDEISETENDGILADLEESCVNGPDSNLLKDGFSESEARDRQAALEVAFENLRSSIATIRSVVAIGEPAQMINEKLRHRSPEFLLFSDEDRDLKSSYNLNIPEIQANPPSALRNLLHLAGTTFGDLLAVDSSGQVHRRATYEKRCNDRLQDVFVPAWSQAKVSVQLKLERHLLYVLVDEQGRDGRRVPLAQRSDGLRLFVALLCFLHERFFNFPAVLLIDEAEAHLHLDAQADLVRHLEGLKQVSQIIYSTHSPGCLPTDLGTGVRLVEPDPQDGELSRLRNCFWDRSVSGFSPMLYAMGAGAAAFSALRAALMCEGAAEMILLPTLIKEALRLPTLPYQVAPGLSSFRGDLGEFDSIASRVVCLVDGDSGGQVLRDRLLRAGALSDRVLSLPAGMALEDLMEPQHYLAAVTSVVKDTGVEMTSPDLAELEGEGPISVRLSAWFESRGLTFPGKVAVAARLAREGNVRISDRGLRAITEIHRKVDAIFSRADR